MLKNIKVCTIDNCEQKHVANGLCRKHYMRMWNYGRLELLDREPIESKYSINQKTGCWEWLLGKDKDGYGKICAGRKSLRAHRYLWELKNGPIPSGLLVCHKCDNPKCVNPDHMFLGTHKDNHDDRGRKNRQAKGEVSGSAKFTENIIQGILTASSYKEAKERFGVSKTHYFRIKRKETWRHILKV